MRIGLIDIIASFLLYIIPGYIFILSFEWLKLSIKEISWKRQIVYSVIISYISATLVKAGFNLFGISEIEINTHAVLSCLLCFLAALVYSLFTKNHIS